MNSRSTIRVLIVDDDEDDYIMLKNLLTEAQAETYTLEWAPSYEAGKAALARREHDVCFLDYRLGIKTGLDLLKAAISEGNKIPMILLTGYGEHEIDLEAMKVGAADYLVKDQITPFLVERSIRYSIHRAQSLQTILEREAQILVQDRLATVGLLASSLAHEIGTPLGVIRGRAEYLGIQIKGDDNIKRSVEVIVSQIDRVTKLIRSLLNLARGEQRQLTGQIDVRQIISEVLELLAHELRRHEIEVKNELTKDISIAVNAEADPFNQVVLNLFVNAIHAVEAAGKAGRKSGHFIKISAQVTDSSCVLVFEDSGCGISQQNLKNLFKPFFTTKDIGEGTGLGLATTYRIVESWGGSIEVKSTEGKGTEFRIRLPKVQAVD